MNREFRRDYGVYCCPHVFNKQRPVLLVIREGGDWQFLCGHSDHTDACHLVGVGHLIDQDPELAQFANLDDGTGAKRESVQHNWVSFELDD